MERNRMKLFAAASLALALGACTTMGTGTGSTSSDGQAVSFGWTSKDGGVTGTMSATLADGTAFTGPYLEITSTTNSTQFYPMWSEWTPWWSDWGYGGFDDGIVQVVTNYTGKVVANLSGSGSQRMRCTFDLNDPRAGMGGGGLGKCQLANGTTVDATFPRA